MIGELKIMSNKKNTILKSSVSIIILVIIFKLLGFIKQAVIAYYFGASGISCHFIM